MTASSDFFSVGMEMADKSEHDALIRRIEALEKELDSARRIITQQESTEKCYRRLLENLARINRAIEKEANIDQMLRTVLETVAAIFDCDRAWVVHPCDPEAAFLDVPIEASKSGQPSVGSLNLETRITPERAQTMRAALGSEIPLVRGNGLSWSADGTERFDIKSEMFLAIHPKQGKPWLFGIDQCTSARVWTTEDRNLFSEIGRRISAGLTCILTLSGLKENEQQFRAMFEQAAVGVALCDSKTGKFIKVNKKYSDIVGFSMDELRRLTFRDITHPDDIHKHMDDFQLLIENKIEEFTLEKRYCRKDGSFVWGRITVSPMWKKQEDPSHHIAILQDITEQKQMENRLKNSENKYRDIFNNLLNVYIETDLDGNILEISPSAEEMSGYKREELIGSKVLDYYADKKKRDELLNVLFSEGMVTNFEADGIHKDGHRVPFSLTARLIGDGLRNPKRLIGMLRNIEERKKAESDILESERRYHSIMEASPDPIVTYDMQGHVLYVNPAFTKVFGWSYEEVAGTKINYVPEGAMPDTLDLRKGAQRRDGFSNFKTQRYDKNGDLIDIDMSVGVWKSGSGDPSGSVAILRDITEQKKAEMQLQRVQKLEAIGTLAGGIAHDFNNILAGILGYSQLAQIHLNNPDQAGKDIEGIQKAGKKATELVQQILTISRQSPEKKEPLEVRIVVKEALKLLRATIPATIEIKERLASQAKVMANPSKIHQVVMNLATNAYHAMPDNKGVLSVGLEEISLTEKNHLLKLDLPTGRYLRLDVSDTGCGMDSILIKKIFDPYFTTKAPDKGTGLGLAVVLSIVEEHYGKIYVYSKSGKGSTFHVYFPTIEDCETPQILERERETPCLGSETVLLVDDDEAVLKATQGLLSEFGYTVAAFSNAAEAMETYLNDPDRFDIVVTDMTMPGITGLELSERILGLNPDKPVILCTGFSESMNREKAIAIGVAEFYQKPIITWEIANVIRSALDHSQRKN